MYMGTEMAARDAGLGVHSSMRLAWDGKRKRRITCDLQKLLRFQSEPGQPQHGLQLLMLWTNDKWTELVAEGKRGVPIRFRSASRHPTSPTVN